jgi:MerR family transcriptional regulator/heat shock protein HspR
MDELDGCFSISVVSRMLSLHPQTIRNYERLGLVNPSRTSGNIRLFSMRDVQRLRQIHTYTSRGVNLAGVEIIVELLERLGDLDHALDSHLQPPATLQSRERSVSRRPRPPVE